MPGTPCIYIISYFIHTVILSRTTPCNFIAYNHTHQQHSKNHHIPQKMSYKKLAGGTQERPGVDKKLAVKDVFQ